MQYIYSLILGAVEGVTEFLPISSTGHLILTSRLLGLPTTEFWKSFEIFIQLGAILAVVVRYGRRVLVDFALLKKIVVAFIPTAVIGLMLYKIIKQYLLGNTAVVLWALALGGIFIILFERWYARQGSGGADLRVLTYRQAFVIGLAQSVAVIPGVSRSAATIIGGLALGVSRSAITEFSFLLAVPTMAAATGLDLLKMGFSFTTPEWGLLLVGFAASFLVALAAINWLLAYVRKHSFVAFGWYRIALAVVYWMALVR